MAQVELLLALRECRPARVGSGRVGELATRLTLASNTISGLVQQLVESGWSATVPIRATGGWPWSPSLPRA